MKCHFSLLYQRKTRVKVFRTRWFEPIRSLKTTSKPSSKSQPKTDQKPPLNRPQNRLQVVTKITPRRTTKTRPKINARGRHSGMDCRHGIPFDKMLKSALHFDLKKGVFRVGRSTLIQFGLGAIQHFLHFDYFLRFSKMPKCCQNSIPTATFPWFGAEKQKMSLFLLTADIAILTDFDNI